MHLWRKLSFLRNSKTSIHLVEFIDETSSHEFQVDSKETVGKYDMIIGSDIMEEMGIYLLYSEHCIVRDSA